MITHFDKGVTPNQNPYYQLNALVSTQKQWFSLHALTGQETGMVHVLANSRSGLHLAVNQHQFTCRTKDSIGKHTDKQHKTLFHSYFNLLQKVIHTDKLNCLYFCTSERTCTYRYQSQSVSFSSMLHKQQHGKHTQIDGTINKLSTPQACSFILLLHSLINAFLLSNFRAKQISTLKLQSQTRLASSLGKLWERYTGKTLPTYMEQCVNACMSSRTLEFGRR